MNLTNIISSREISSNRKDSNMIDDYTCCSDIPVSLRISCPVEIAEKQRQEIQAALDELEAAANDYVDANERASNAAAKISMVRIYDAAIRLSTARKGTVPTC